MDSRGRRAFLMGRRPPGSPWEEFCGRLRRLSGASLSELSSEEGHQSARLVVQEPAAAHLALQACRQFKVTFALDGVADKAEPVGPVLWVRPGAEMSAFKRMEPGSRLWFVQPGCLLGELEAEGFTAFADLPAYISVAAWLADRRLCNWASGRTAQSGLMHASAMLADGISVTLGAFGPNNRKALDHLRLQTLVPKLFNLSSSPEGRACAERSNWPARYRLDALTPSCGVELNLSHLLLGHGGDLAWVEWVVLDESACDPGAGTAVPLDLPGVAAGEAADDRRSGAGHHRDGRVPAEDLGGSGPCEAVNLVRAAQDLDAAVKHAFDPDGVFPYPGQAF